LNKEAVSDIEKLRQQLLQNNSRIDFEDFGAGSRTIRSSNKTIKSIAGNQLKPKRIAEIIYNIVAHYSCFRIVELGTSLGITTSYIAKAQKSIKADDAVKLISIEGSKSIHEIASKNLESLHLSTSTTLINSNFDDCLVDILKDLKSVDLFFVDGNHTKNATINYFEAVLPFAHNSTIIIFDDIYWSEGMSDAWNYIKNSEAVTCTIDLFFMGIVVLRKEQTKQHFTLRVL